VGKGPCVCEEQRVSPQFTAYIKVQVTVLQAIILVTILAYGKEEFASEVLSSEK
jgi:hypothetical protein